MYKSKFKRMLVAVMLGVIASLSFSNAAFAVDLSVAPYTEMVSVDKAPIESNVMAVNLFTASQMSREGNESFERITRSLNVNHTNDNEYDGVLVKLTVNLPNEVGWRSYAV